MLKWLGVGKEGGGGGGGVEKGGGGRVGGGGGGGGGGGAGSKDEGESRFRGAGELAVFVCAFTAET